MSIDQIINFEHAAISVKDHLVLSDVTFSMNKGEFLYVIGRVGSGKTSLIKTINAELPLEEGHALIAGFDLEKIRHKEIPYLRRKLGIVFQDFQLLTDRTVYQNLEFVLKATGWKVKTEINDRISEVLEKVDLGYKGYKMPNQLSGGEQQRVVIARALLNDPEIILADEPTGNLDTRTGHEIMEMFHELNHKDGITIVMVTHEREIAEYTRRIINLRDGVVNDEEVLRS